MQVLSDGEGAIAKLSAVVKGTKYEKVRCAETWLMLLEKLRKLDR
jgi:hypothetical protein